MPAFSFSAPSSSRNSNSILAEVLGRHLAAMPLLVLLAGAGAAKADIVINEIHYHPDIKTEKVEFIELFNTGASAVSLAGWRLAGGIDFVFPSGVSIAPAGYVVVAQEPGALQAKFGVEALGPWSGTLSNEGDTVRLLDELGGTQDEVEYQAAFPWPIVGDPPGYSIELANPAFDNQLGGNWRASHVGDVTTSETTFVPAGATWKFFRGYSEPSEPNDAWRSPDFDDSSWESGPSPIGYDPALPMGTYLDDMRGNYTTVYLRTEFFIDDPRQVGALVIAAQYDDGFNIWINGKPAPNCSVNMPSTDAPFYATAPSAREDFSFVTIDIGPSSGLLVKGRNVIAVQGANVNRSNSTDFYLDLKLSGSIGPSQRGPTPGAVNSVSTTNLPPQIRQVSHSPQQPKALEPVTITAKITDPEGVAAVTLQYQVVAPGNYIELTDAAYTNSWQSVAMNDEGSNGDAFAGDSVYTAVLPASVQQHRRLIRYRVTARDNTGAELTVPYADDPQPNFAYFCYNGVPAWNASLRAGGAAVTFDTNVMRRLPVVHLLAKKSAVEDATWFSGYWGDAYPWAGTLVVDGEVYDHVHYRARGGVWRYAMVKNMWKFDLNPGHALRMPNDYGKPYKSRWTKLNLGACIQQGDYNHRGEQGMFEAVGFRLFNLVGVEAPNTTFLQFRVIDDPEEAPADQYEGDFWGLYLAVEQENGRFLDEHNLPDGNFYKMESGTGGLNNLGPDGPTDKSDLNAFQSYVSDDTWWRNNLDLERYYSYRTIVEGIHHYDIDDPPGKNYFYYHNPETDIWLVHSWDLDLTWADNMYGGGNEPFKSRVLPRAAFNLDFKNRVREIRDLLFNTDQASQLIDEYAWLVRGPTNGPTFLDADRYKWDYNPKMTDPNYSTSLSKAGQGRFYQFPESVSKDFNGLITLMKNYVVTRASTLDSLAADAAIPSRPSITYVGSSNFSLTDLRFTCSTYSGSSPFAALRWRVAEITSPQAPAYQPGAPVHYEINAVWESPEITNYQSEVHLPAVPLKAGHAYRARARMKDVAGRWSNWSEPVEFVASVPESSTSLVQFLKLTELMYQPPGGSDYEYVELYNSSADVTLNLAGANFTAGIDFGFPDGTVIPPNGYLLLTRNTDLAAFRDYYHLSSDIAVLGPYTGSLANNGETLTLKTSAGGEDIFTFSFNTGYGWPVAAKGAGHSLIPLERGLAGQASGSLDYPGNWRPSAHFGGSPGKPDPTANPAAVVLNELVAHTDYADPSRPEYDSNDWLELYNAGSAAVTMTNCYLSDDPAQPTKWAIPTVTLPAGGRITFDEVSGFHSPITNGFGLDKAGEQLLLSYVAGTAEDRVLDAIQFKGQENGRSFGRYPDGTGSWRTMLPTRDDANTGPISGVVISEVMYHPPNLTTNDNTVDEYIELYNPGDAPALLQDTNGAWRLDGGISYTFPANVSLPARGSLLVVNVDPTDTSAVDRLRQRYGITNNTALFGPYSGKLSNRSDRVALEKPQYPDLPGDPYSWIIVDQVTYGNQDPWPAEPNGLGSSLQRRLSEASGDDPANWLAGTPSPGSTQTTAADSDQDGMPDEWELQHGLSPSDPADARLDPDGDGMINLHEYLSGTDPKDPASVLKFISAAVESGEVSLRFQAAAGYAYSIQFRDSAGGTWSKLKDYPAQSVAAELELRDPVNVAGARFYRLTVGQ